MSTVTDLYSIATVPIKEMFTKVCLLTTYLRLILPCSCHVCKKHQCFNLDAWEHDLTSRAMPRF